MQLAIPGRRRRAVATFATAVVAAAAFMAVVPAAQADVTDNGGASRTDDEELTDTIRDALIDGPAKNVILLIGDGMGDSEITVARNYVEGAGGTFAGIDELPLTGSYTTWAVNPDGTPNYASESASTASAWNTGTKTVNGQLSIDVDGAPQATLLELARANGLRTGTVSTAEIQDATPAAGFAHISNRACYGPEEVSELCTEAALENGGLGSVSEQLLNLRPDVVLGGGSASFEQTAVAGPWEGQTLFEQAEDRGFQLVSDAAELQAVTQADATSPVLGLFTPGNFPVRYAGPEATIDGGDLPAEPCTENPDRLDTGLSLGALTSSALDLLDNEDGFFLQVEGASIDKQDHEANACGQIGETVDLDEAVQVALDYARQDQDTLVIVTADHAHTSQIVGSSTPGLTVNLLTEEGQEMIVAYGTSPAGGSQQHTGAQVRIAAYGPGAANVIGLTDQTDVYFTASRTLELDRDLLSLSDGATITASADVVEPGESVTITAEGMAADWQTSAETSGGELLAAPVLSGSGFSVAPRAPVIDDSSSVRDVIFGSVSYTVEAPTTPGPFTVAIEGHQTGTTLSVELQVDEDAPPTGDPTTDDPSTAPSTTDTPTSDPAPGAVGGDGASGPGGGLPSTGAAVGLIALIAAALTAVGVLLRRRATAAAQA